MGANIRDLIALEKLRQQEQENQLVMSGPQMPQEGSFMGVPYSALAQIVQQNSQPVQTPGQALTAVSGNYLENRQAQVAQRFRQGIQMIAGDPSMDPATKMNAMIQHITAFGANPDDYKEILGAWKAQMEQQSKGPAEWKPTTKAEALEFENAKAGNKPPSQAMETTALYASRIKQANGVFGNLDNYINNLGGWAIVNSKTPDWLNFTKGEQYQSYEQAQRNFLNAVLRRESGAVISPSEFAEGKRQYFPQPGDKPAVLAQKKANRDLVEKNFIKAAGRAYVPYEETQNQPNGMPAGAAFYSPSTKKYYDAEGNEL